ncbi:hypothetical protein [Rhodococcus sp. ACPA1]|uniref:hypothetical protein n=1 Tax=Rhodococcus sp. ACPA1 TaxID=2028572 RepID=UPI000BB10345|nr:hypothetical protein [Rhodococcus sp. ACPA1]PBC57961.1 hypothetical protein CJ177_08985 [Rhodococcus sp. ACPA1]
MHRTTAHTGQPLARRRQGDEGPHHHPGRIGAAGAGSVDRNFRIDRPDALSVADFTYVRTVPGFAHTGLAIDAFASTILGWEGSASKETAFVQRSVNQACSFRLMQGNLLRKNIIRCSRPRTTPHDVPIN